ncbi:uncharacterized protein VTP21DRAFT_5351 [Calcarisporiella thermophila]|uniref:uncharacterized protein n=1 Tax=Calcarisporiella thermophila TaxID=911321 RepID=UPI0037449124
MIKKFLIPIVTLSALLGAFAAPVNTDKPLTTFFVASDTHHDYADLGMTLKDMLNVDPKYKAVVFNGDITNQGREKQYSDFLATLQANPHPDKVFLNIGNHELYGGDSEEAMFARYKKLTKEDKIYYEREVGGFPLIFLGTEKFLDSGNGVWLSPEQLNWLRDRLKIHGRTGKPIFTFLHIPLPKTTSGSQVPVYETLYKQQKELLDILGQYPQAILFTSHTHYGLQLSDWQVRKVIPGGNSKGFQIINTGGILDEWNADSNGNEYLVPGSIKEARSLYLELYANRVVITGRDHYRKKWIQKLEIPYGNAVSDETV